MRKIKIGNYFIPLWIIVVLLISGVGVSAFYVWQTLTVQLQVKEPLEILSYPSQLSLYPGETKEFNVTIENHASVNYSVTLDFHLSNLTYQADYVNFNDTVYTIVPGQQNITAWFSVKSDAPSTSDTLSISFERIESAAFYSGLISYWKFGGNASIFDGINDYINIPSFTLPDLTSLTVTAWINSPLTQIGYIFYNGENGEFVLHNGERPYDGSVSGRYPTLASFSVKLQGSSIWDVYSTPMTSNTLHFLAGVWIKGVSLRIYVDGVLVGENNTIPNENLYNPGSGYIATVGRYYIPEPNYFKGSIYEIRIYNRALSNTEIGDLYSIPP